MKSAKEVQDFMDKYDWSVNKMTGMTYEQGIEAALMWVLDEVKEDEILNK